MGGVRRRKLQFKLHNTYKNQVSPYSSSSLPRYSVATLAFDHSYDHSYDQKARSAYNICLPRKDPKNWHPFTA